MAEIATYTMIKTKTSYGSTGTECPPKKIIKAISSYISIANESSYGDNEAVKLEDISATAYTFTVANNSKSIGAAGGITSAVDFTSKSDTNFSGNIKTPSINITDLITTPTGKIQTNN